MFLDIIPSKFDLTNTYGLGSPVLGFMDTVMGWSLSNKNISLVLVSKLIKNLLTIILMLLIKKFIIDDKKILTEIEKNKQKPAKVGGFRARLQTAMEEAEKKKRNNEKRR